VMFFLHGASDRRGENEGSSRTQTFHVTGVELTISGRKKNRDNDSKKCDVLAILYQHSTTYRGHICLYILNSYLCEFFFKYQQLDLDVRM
jgi:hypothetical protein